MHYLPTRIVFGNDAVTKGSAYLGRYGKKALLVTGSESAILSGAQDDVISVLQYLQIDWVVFNHITENPGLDEIIEGAGYFTENGCDFVIGIGGGSPIDAAKAISLTAANLLSKTEIYDITKFKHSYPVVAVPTTAGTGTEVTQYSVLTDKAKQKKAGFGHDLAFPVLALIDPGYTISLPHRTTLNTSIDALSHLLEGIYSNKRSALLYPIIFQGISLIYSNLSGTLNDLSDYRGREALMRASLFGGMTISQTSTTLQHSIGYPLTSVFNVPHGLANGIVMKDMMELYYPAVKAELVELFVFLGISKDKFYNWLDSLDMKAEIEITSDFMNERIPEVLNSRNMVNNPFDVSFEDIRNIYMKLR